MVKVGLVLEGGGMRGAYSAGALAWLIDNNLEFDYSVGISSGAVHLCSYLMKSKDFLYDISVRYMTDKNNVGLPVLLKCGRYVNYDYLFNDILYKQLKYDISSLISSDYNFELGVFDCEKGDTFFYGKDYMDKELNFLKAACSLPIAGRIVDYKQTKILDGGIKIMVPLERSLEMGTDKNLIITTKPEGYVRKEASFFMKNFMKLNFLKYPSVYKHYNVRHLNYKKEMDLVKKCVEEGKAINIRPSKSIKVKRFSGDFENLDKLYKLGYQDMEDNKEAIFALFK